MQAVTTIYPQFEKLIGQLFNSDKDSESDLLSSPITIVTGFNYKDTIVLQELVKFKYPSLDCFIIAKSAAANEKYISIAEINTFQQDQTNKMILMLPADIAIGFESFDHLQYQEVSNNDLEERLVKDLMSKIPEAFAQIIKDDIIDCLGYLKKDVPVENSSIINYLDALENSGYTAEHIGDFIYLFGLIPDKDLLADATTTRGRLQTNLASIHKLLEYNKLLYDRILELPIHKNSVQRHIVDYFRNNPEQQSPVDFGKTVFEDIEMLNFSNWDILEEAINTIALPTEHITPEYDLLIGNSAATDQFGLIGESISGRKVAIDLSGTNTISLFGVQGGGKSYTIGTIAEMVLKQFSHVCELPSPLAGVIFHYSESMDYEPEFTSMIYANDKEREIEKLKRRYGADPDSLDDVVILCPADKVKEKQLEYPSVEIKPISFNPQELNVKDWMFMLGALGSNANYVKQLKAIAKKHRKDINLDVIEKDVLASPLFTDFERELALQKLDFAREYVDSASTLRDLLYPGRLIIVDLRDEFIDKDEALGLFVIILNIFSGVQKVDGKRFNKFIVFDEAHKYMDNKDLTSNIVTTIREMRHKGVNIMIASQDPPSLPVEIIELSSVVLLHKFNSPHWLTHIKNALTQLEILSPQDMNVLTPGEGYLWATKATEKGITHKPLKITARPRVTKHGGGTLLATNKK